jgi:hypothetical protein
MKPNRGEGTVSSNGERVENVMGTSLLVASLYLIVPAPAPEGT